MIHLKLISGHNLAVRDVTGYSHIDWHTDSCIVPDAVM